MCNAKPGTRCASDTAEAIEKTQTRLRDALVQHAQDIDNAQALTAVKVASQDLWLQQLEQAAIQHPSPPPEPGTDWWADAGAALQQAHKDQEALMPVRPPADAPKDVIAAYRYLAAARDDLARRDAIEIADHLTFAHGTTLPPEPVHAPRPAMWDVEMRVAQAERAYHQALNPGQNYGPGENWRLLMHSGHMPYDHHDDATHPQPRESAPWVHRDYTRSVTPGDLASIRRATGQAEHIDWDPHTERILIHPNPYGEAYDHDRHVAAYQRSLWQVGYLTTLEDDHIVIHAVPDLPAWRASHARTRKMQAVS